MKSFLTLKSLIRSKEVRPSTLRAHQKVIIVKQPNRGLKPEWLRLLVVCLLTFANLTAPLAVIAAPGSIAGDQAELNCGLTQAIPASNLDTPAGVELSLGAPIERELSAGQSDLYKVNLTVGQFMRVIVDQKGIDVVVTLVAPSGEKVIDVDSPSGARGPESVSVIAETTGSYRLEVKAFNQKAARGRYKVSLEDKREPTDQDRMRIKAETALVKGTQLYWQGTSESLREAIDLFNVGLPLFKKLGDEWRQALTLTVMGLIHVYLGESKRALDFYKQSLPHRRTANDRLGEAITFHNMGTACKSLGELQQALEYYDQALSLLSGLGETSEARTLNNIGMIYASLGEPARALDYFNKALVIADNGADRAGQAAKARGETLDALGDLYSQLNQHQMSLEYYNRALSSKRLTGDKREEAKTLSNIGLEYWTVGEFKKSLEHYDQAILLERTVGDILGEAVTLSRVGLTYSSLGRLEESLGYFERALLLHRAVGDRDSEAATLARLAQVELNRGRLNEARTHIEASLAIVETTRSKFVSRDLRTSYLGTSHSRYEFYINLLMRMHRDQPNAGYDAAALHASEQARARGLLESLTEAKADIRQGVDPILLERERSLRQDLNAKAEALMRRLNTKQAPSEELSARKELEALLAEYDDVQTQIKIRSPRYAALTRPEPITANEIQQRILDEDTLLLEYALGDEHSYLWAVTRTSLRSYKLPKRAEIESKTRRVYDLFVNKAETLFPEALTELSQTLLGPVASQLGQKRLLIVADGALQYLPFGALSVPVSNSDRVVGAKAATATKSQPLILQHEIAYLPSASVMTVLGRERSKRETDTNKLIIFADPVFEKSDERVLPNLKSQHANGQGRVARNQVEPTTPPSDVRRSMSDLGMTKFERLPISRREANQITNFIPSGQSLKQLDFRASRANLLESGIGQFKIVHFATHGLLNNSHPELSGIVLSLVNEQGQPQDGFLRLYDIYNLRLASDLVVLSACQTALGKEIKGEGLMGLTRGFMYAGSPGVVGSLWKVSDSATAELMSRFYEHMFRKGMRPPEALRMAQVSMLREKQWAAPFYWAGFVFQGEWR